MNLFERNSDECINHSGYQKWHRVVSRDFGGGLMELSVCPYETWAEPDLEDLEREKAKRGEGNRELSAERVARRARTKVRHSCKQLKARYMVTLTTKECITDLDRFNRMFKEFVRRVRSVQGFEYIAVPEYQARGALHLHIAVATRQNYKLLWSIWLAVCGEGNGRVHVTKGIKKNDISRIAAYLAKYITKGFENVELNKRRYWASRNIADPVKTVDLIRGDWSIVEVLKYLGLQLSELGLPWSFGTAHLNDSAGIFWIAVNPPDPS